MITKVRGMILICFALALGATGAGAANESVFTSFLDYRPKATQFPGPLQPIASSIEEGDTLKASGQKDAAASKFRSALDAADAAAKRTNRSIEDQLWFLKGVAHESLGQEQKAEQAFERALKARPNNLLARFRHAYLLKQRNKCEDAISEFQEIEWRVKELSYEMNYLEGECFLAMGKKEEAVKQFERSYKKKSSFLPVVKRLLHVRQEMLAEASTPTERSTLEAQIASDLNTIAKAEPADRTASITLTRMLLDVKDPVLEKGKIEQAEALAKKAAEQSDYKDDAFVRLLAEAQIKKGMLEEADTIIKRGLKMTPNSQELAVAKKQLEIERSLLTSQTGEK